MTKVDQYISLKPWLFVKKMEDNRLNYYFTDNLKCENVRLITFGYIG